MQKNKYFTTIALVLTVLAISAVSAFAATGNTKAVPTKAERLAKFEEMDVKFEEMRVKHEEVLKAVLAGNYDAWYALVTENDKTPKILEVINEDNFAQFSKAHQLMEEGRQMLEDLGVEKGMGMQRGVGNGMMSGFKGHGGMMKGLNSTVESN